MRSSVLNSNSNEERATPEYVPVSWLRNSSLCCASFADHKQSRENNTAAVSRAGDTSLCSRLQSFKMINISVETFF